MKRYTLILSPVNLNNNIPMWYCIVNSKILNFCPFSSILYYNTYTQYEFIINITKKHFKNNTYILRIFKTINTFRIIINTQIFTQSTHIF